MAALPDDAGFSAGLAPVHRRPQRNARTGDKNNIYIVGHAAFGQGLMQLERYNFEDAATSLEGAWTVWKDVFLGAPTKPMPVDPRSSEEEEESESSSESESETDSSSDHLPERPRRIGANEAAAKAFFKAKNCNNEGAGVGATFAPAGPIRKTSSGSGSDSGSKPRRRRPPKGFADDGEPAPPPEQEDRMGVWPPVPTVDIFAEALTDALILRVTRATEEEALACALEAQQQIMATAGQESQSDDDDDESEDEELSTVAYTQRAYKRDVQIMMKEPSEGTTAQPGEFASSKETKTYETSGAKPQFHHYRRLMRGLCHCYVRLRRWVDLDRFIEEAIPYFQEVRSMQRKKVPQFKNKDREELWITLQMQRAAACILIGRDHYEKADKFLQNVRKVQPKDRVLQRTVDSIEFLREQLKDVSAGDSAANTEDTLLTQAMLAMRW